MCGDSTDKPQVERLMNGEKADMVFTDPPYNVNYSGKGKKTSKKIENDNMSSDDFHTFLLSAFQNIADFINNHAGLYICYASREHINFETALKDAGLEVVSQIIWNKKKASFGWANYRYKHEPILYCKKSGQKVNYYGNRKQVTVWNEETMTDDEKLRYALEIVEDMASTTVWNIGTDSKYEHPTQKPSALPAIAVANSSKKDDVVLDLFAGSGSTLMAAHQMQRTFYGMEFDPKYADVIRKRYAKFTSPESWEEKWEELTPEITE